jgi:hypothetical protein
VFCTSSHLVDLFAFLKHLLVKFYRLIAYPRSNRKEKRQRSSVDLRLRVGFFIMPRFLPQVLFAGVLVVLVTQNIIFWCYSNEAPGRTAGLSADYRKPSSTSEAQITTSANPKEWFFAPHKDSENFALNKQQCDFAFPHLWLEIDRSISVWKNNISRPIAAKDISLDSQSGGVFRALIHENQLRILETKGILDQGGSQMPFERTIAVWQQIHRAILGATAAGEMLPSIEFSVSVDDKPNLHEGKSDDTHTIWAFCRHRETRAHDRVFLMPDFNFWSWRGVAGSFAEMQAYSKDLDRPLSEKIPKLAWRGAIWTNPGSRGSLREVTKDKRSNFVAIEDFCRFAFLVHTEGRSWSGRLKYLLNCESVTLIHELEWTAHYYHLLNPEGHDQNYVPVERDFSDLGDKVQYYMNNPRKAQRIADNGIATFRGRYLTLAAEACYWRRLIEGWNEVAVSPEIYELSQVNLSGVLETKRSLRGVAFEELIVRLRERAEWPPKVQQE